MKEVEVVQIHRDDFLLREVALQLDGNHPLNRLLKQTFELAMSRFGIELLGQLLRDGRATTSALLTHNATLHDGTSQGNEVDARVLVETLVLGSHQRLHQMGRKLVVRHHDAILTIEVPCAYHLSVGRKHLRGKTADGILQVLQVGHVADKPKPDGEKARHQRADNDGQRPPKKMYKRLSH